MKNRKFNSTPTLLTEKVLYETQNKMNEEKQINEKSVQSEAKQGSNTSINSENQMKFFEKNNLRHSYSLENTKKSSQSTNNLINTYKFNKIHENDSNLHSKSRSTNLLDSNENIKSPLETTMEEDLNETTNSSVMNVANLCIDYEALLNCVTNIKNETIDVKQILFTTPGIIRLNKNEMNFSSFLNDLDSLKSVIQNPNSKSNSNSNDNLLSLSENLSLLLNEMDMKTAPDSDRPKLKTNQERVQYNHNNANLLPDIDDDDDMTREEAICDDVNNDNDANTTTDENLDADDFMDDDMLMLNEFEKINIQQQQQQQQQQQTNNTYVTQRRDSLHRMRDLKRRHVLVGSNQTHHYQQQQQQQQQQQRQHHHHHHPDEFVLKCQFSALIPAFDPRPGKVNINQIQDIVVPQQTPLETTKKTQDDAQINAQNQNQALKLDLYLKVNSKANDNNDIEFYDDEIKLTNKSATIFQYIQSLLTTGPNCSRNFSTATLKYEKMKSIWDTSYTLIYREAKKQNENTDTEKDENYEIFTEHTSNNKCQLNDILKLLSILKKLIDSNGDYPSVNEEFYSKKINNKLIQQLQDSLVLASRSLPDWCMNLIHSYKFLFPFETRQLYFQTTAFGVSRSIVWLQNKRDTLLANIRGPTSGAQRRDHDQLHNHEFRIGRLKHERVKIPREPSDIMLENAINTLKFHATRKAILEFEFVNEEGTGLGPTLEFYSLVAAELQRKKHALWYCDDNEAINEELDEYKQSIFKTNEHFIHPAHGLFPAPYYPQFDCKKFEKILDLFQFMGIFIAKSLQDQRLVDIPFSMAFLKILCFYEEHDIQNNLDEILKLDDLQLIDPYRAQLIKSIKILIDKKNEIDSNEFLNEFEKQKLISNLELKLNSTRCKIEDLGLVFQYSPPSIIYGYKHYDLVDNGEYKCVNISNANEYIDCMHRFIFKTGIEKQIKAFKYGFDSVFPMDSLKCCTPNELQILLSGDQAPKWTRETIINYTEPKLGYTRESPGFQRFVNVMCSMDDNERKSFVQFLTGCSSLPPGGLANLHPRLTIVKKDGTDANYPSVNTCVHYLKLPEYSSEKVLKKRLTVACKEKGFYLN